MARTDGGPDSDPWSIDEVVGKLRGQVGADGRAGAHVFLDDTAGDDLAASASRLVKAAYRGTRGGNKIDIGSIGQLGRQPGVRAILPSEIDDVYPKPVKRTPA